MALVLSTVRSVFSFLSEKSDWMLLSGRCRRDRERDNTNETHFNQTFFLSFFYPSVYVPQFVSSPLNYGKIDFQWQLQTSQFIFIISFSVSISSIRVCFSFCLPKQKLFYFKLCRKIAILFLISQKSPTSKGNIQHFSTLTRFVWLRELLLLLFNVFEVFGRFWLENIIPMLVWGFREQNLLICWIFLSIWSNYPEIPHSNDTTVPGTKLRAQFMCKISCAWKVIFDIARTIFILIHSFVRVALYKPLFTETFQSSNIMHFDYDTQTQVLDHVTHCLDRNNPKRFPTSMKASSTIALGTLCWKISNQTKDTLLNWSSFCFKYLSKSIHSVN